MEWYRARLAGDCDAYVSGCFPFVLSIVYVRVVCASGFENVCVFLFVEYLVGVSCGGGGGASLPARRQVANFRGSAEEWLLRFGG